MLLGKVGPNWKRKRKDGDIYQIRQNGSYVLTRPSGCWSEKGNVDAVLARSLLQSIYLNVLTVVSLCVGNARPQTKPPVPLKLLIPTSQPFTPLRPSMALALRATRALADSSTHASGVGLLCLRPLACGSFLSRSTLRSCLIKVFIAHHFRLP